MHVLLNGIDVLLECMHVCFAEWCRCTVGMYVCLAGCYRLYVLLNGVDVL